MPEQTKKILLVEDDPSQAVLITRLLQHATEQSFVIEHVGTLADAMPRVEDQACDAVLLDLNLPDSEGLDTVVRVRNVASNKPVVVLTGLDDTNAGIKAIECGAQDFVVKGMVSGGLLVRSLQFAIARQKQILHYRMEANTDALTGLANRRAFRDELERRYSLLNHHNEPCSLILLDIDHFKSINDRLGHRTGDFVLSTLANVLSSNLAKTDFAARYGGEEFAILISGRERAEGEDIVRRLRLAIQQLDIEFENTSLQVTASFGFAEAVPGELSRCVVERADQALYTAKRAGRNRGCHMDDGQYRFIAVDDQVLRRTSLS